MSYHASAAATIAALAALITPPFSRVAQDDIGTPRTALIDAYFIDPGFADQAECEAYAAEIPGASDGEINATVLYCGTLFVPPCDYSGYLSGATTEAQCDGICATIDSNPGCVVNDCLAVCASIEW